MIVYIRLIIKTLAKNGKLLKHFQQPVYFKLDKIHAFREKVPMFMQFTARHKNVWFSKVIAVCYVDLV